jgi:Na+/melibiose symporter-like transporter
MTPISRRRLLGYAAGSVGNGVFSAVPGLLLLYYLTDVLGVSAALAGLLIVVPKIWDVLFNPVVGAASDREAVRTGRRTRIMAIGAIALPVMFAIMFAAPSGLRSAAAAEWVALAFLLSASAYACFQVPYMALPAEISESPDQRGRAMAWRIVFVTFGILVAGGLAPTIVDAVGKGRTGYAVMGASIGVLLAIVMIGSTLATRWIPSRPGPTPLTLPAALRAARGNKPFFALVGAFAAQSLATAVMLAGAPYLATYRLHDYGLTSIMFLCIVAPSAIAVPVWRRLAQRHGAIACYLASVILFAAAAAALYPATDAGSVAATLTCSAVLGVAYAAIQLLPQTLLPETVHADAGRTGQAQAGAFTGLWTAAETGSLALGPGVYAVILALSAFKSSAFNAPAPETSSALTGLSLGATVSPALLMVASIPFLLAYRRAATTHQASLVHQPADARL